MFISLRVFFFSALSFAFSFFPKIVAAQTNFGTLDAPDPDTSVSAASSLQSTSVTDIVVGIMKGLLYIVGFLAIIAFVIAAIWYLTAAGDEGRAETGKKTMIAAIIGVIVALVGLIVVNAVTNILGGKTRF